MDLFVSPALVLDVAFDDILVCVLSHRVHVETARPEVTAPEDLLHCGMMIEDVLGCQTLDDLGDARWSEDRNALQEKVDMICIRSDLDESDFIPLLDGQTNLFQCSLDGVGKGLFPVFHGTNQVVEKESFVVTLVDVLTHALRVHLREPTPHATCEVSRNDVFQVLSLHYL